MPHPSPQPVVQPEVVSTTAAGGARSLALSGAWNLRGLERRLAELAPRLAEYAADKNSQWDLRGVDVIDHAGAMLLWRAWGRRRAPNLVLKPEQESVFNHLEIPVEAGGSAAQPDPLWIIVAVGRKLLRVLDHCATMLTVLGYVVLDAAYLVRRPARVPWREISANIYRTGTQALGITALVGFLVGVVLSYLSAQQLKLFGADAFIINILGISVVRELGPVLAAILIAGRSGSAITAQLGVMRVTQELDAMAVMGIPHTLRLILPKMIALAVSMPLIVLWTNSIALAGGMISAQAELGISYAYFLASLPDAVPIANLWLGLGKGVVFGFLIALVACHFGLRIEPNTESLGIGTTNSVVTSITVVIIVDAIFAIMFKDVGIS
jgi:phospholipid/cholesterol/gamma-HCH transport system permease protein